MRNKSSTSKPAEPLHPLPIPDDYGDSICMDSIGPLPVDNGFDCILTITDRLHSDVRIIPTTTTLSAEDCAIFFFENWYCKNGLPLEIISNRSKLFISKFWKQLMLMTGIKHKCSSSYHPQTNGSSKFTNKTVNQCLRFHVEQNQSGWAKALPLVCFQIINTVNKSVGYSLFQLCLGRSARVIPPLTTLPNNAPCETINAHKIIEIINTNVADAKDNLMLSKLCQSLHTNNSRSKDIPYKVGDQVMLSTLNRQRDYKTTGERRVAKFMPRFNSPYLVTDTFPEASTVTLDIPHAPNLFPTFHASHVKPFIPNDDLKFPS
jgi:hypothetical protein